MTLPRDASPIGTSKFSSPAVPPKVLLVFGTRPEAIKLSPVIRALRQLPAGTLEPVVCVTAQHRAMLDQVLETFEIRPDYDLRIMQPGQTLSALTARLISGLAPVIEAVRPAVTVVQGDTTTTFAGALTSFYARVPVAHVEAGLRTFDLSAPFPEEMNRRFTTGVAALHFAPTEQARANLLRDGVPPDSITVTGNTGIDAVLDVATRLNDGQLSGTQLPLDQTKRLVLVTAHRRESFGEPLRQICEAVATLARRGDVQIVWPVHPNPVVQQSVDAVLKAQENVMCVGPQEYVQFVDLLRRAHVILTDSGGIQEEAPSLGKPVLLLREKTERPEAVEAGGVRIVGYNRDRIVREATTLLDDPGAYRRMAQVRNPYGDGTAAGRIARLLGLFLAERCVSLRDA